MHYLGQGQPFIDWKRSPQRGGLVLAQAASKMGGLRLRFIRHS